MLCYKISVDLCLLNKHNHCHETCLVVKYDRCETGVVYSDNTVLTFACGVGAFSAFYSTPGRPNKTGDFLLGNWPQH